MGRAGMQSGQASAMVLLLLLALTAAGSCSSATPSPEPAAAPAAAPAPTRERAAALSAESYFNAAGLPLLTPTNRSTDGRAWYFEVPKHPVGLLVMLHRCGRNAEDFWPPSRVCPQCIGMPEGVSISKQALARGYALLAINSADRDVGPGTRCWSWASDANAVHEIVEDFRREQRLTRLPLLFTGCSSGGSLALRLPGIMRIDGIMPVAIGLTMEAFPLARDPGGLEHPYPPVAFVHFVRDNNTDAKIAGMMQLMKQKGVPAAQARVTEFAINPDFFARRDSMISLAVSKKLHAEFMRAGMLNASNYIADAQTPTLVSAMGTSDIVAGGWEANGQPPPWEPVLQDQLGRMLELSRSQQLSLKSNTTLALAQQALAASGDLPLFMQEVGPDRVAAAAADDAANTADANPNFSDSDGMSSSSAGQDPYLSAKLLDQHIKEEIAVAEARHTNMGDYTTAALIWLERCGKVSFDRLAAKHAVLEPAALSPVRVVPAANVRAAWRACRHGGMAPRRFAAAPAAGDAASRGRRLMAKPPRNAGNTPAGGTAA